MRFRQPLDGLFTSRTSTRVLRVLARSPEKRFTSLELAGAAGAPPHRVLEALRRLELEGIVSSRVVGRAYLWTANRRNPLLRVLEALFKGEEGASAGQHLLLGKHLARAPGLRRVVLFGSAARGEERPESDLDLLVVVDRDSSKEAVQDRLGALKGEAQEKYGSRVRPQLFTEREYARKRKSPLIQAVEREGQPLDVPPGGP